MKPPEEKIFRTMARNLGILLLSAKPFVNDCGDWLDSALYEHAHQFHYTIILRSLKEGPVYER